MLCPIQVLRIQTALNVWPKKVVCQCSPNSTKYYFKGFYPKRGKNSLLADLVERDEAHFRIACRPIHTALEKKTKKRVHKLPNLRICCIFETNVFNCDELIEKWTKETLNHCLKIWNSPTLTEIMNPCWRRFQKYYTLDYIENPTRWIYRAVKNFRSKLGVGMKNKRNTNLDILMAHRNGVP